MHGKWTEWYENGQKKIESDHLADKMHGKVTIWYGNGQKMAEIEYRDNKRIRGKGWDKNGNPISIDQLGL